jgi:tetratricopeptide (TPR) repeat protein
MMVNFSMRLGAQSKSTIEWQEKASWRATVDFNAGVSWWPKRLHFGALVFVFELDLGSPHCGDSLEDDGSMAIADYTRATDINPRYGAAYFNRGIAYQAKGDHDRAIADFTKAIEINPRLNAYKNRRQNANGRKFLPVSFSKATLKLPDGARFYVGDLESRA